MADSWGPGYELEQRRLAYEQARRQYDVANAEVADIRSPRIGDADELARRFDVADLARRAAAEREEQLRQSLKHAATGHPASQYRKIMAEADEIQAPELSWWQWWQQNPSVLEAVPLTDQQRTDNARLSHVLKRVHEAANAGSPSDPMHWSNHQGPEAQHMADLQVLAAEHYGVPGSGFSGNPERRRQLESPYSYRRFNRDEDGQTLPLPEQLGEALRPLGALWGGVSRFKDNFISGGAAAAEGRWGDAGMAAAYAVPNLVSPAFHRGGPDAASDWRGYVGPGEAAAMDVAFDLPFWLTRGVYGRSSAAGDRIRKVRSELLKPAYQRAAWANHPDRGGSAEAMSRINNAMEAGDLEALLRFSQ